MLVFNYSRAMAQVQELRSIANEMQRSPSLTNAINGAKTSWKGQTSDQFQKKCEALMSLIQNEIKNIRIVADNLEKTARVIEAAERAAIGTLGSAAAKGAAAGVAAASVGRAAVTGVAAGAAGISGK